MEQRLARVTLPSPAYAVALWGGDGFFPTLLIGLEADREQLSSLPATERFSMVWNLYESPIRERLREDDAIRALYEGTTEELQTQDTLPEQYVLGHVAKRITLKRPLTPVTHDFVAYAYDPGDDEEILKNLQFAATPDAAAILRAKNLLPKRFGDLLGAR